MKYLILILSTLLMFACATVREKVVVDVVKQSVPDEAIKPHILPKDIMTDDWEVVGQESCPVGRYMDVYLTNKDFNSDVRYATVRISPQYRAVIGYAYMIKGKIYVFQSKGSGVYGPAELRDTDIKFWIEKFKHYFLSNNLEECSKIEQTGG